MRGGSLRYVLNGEAYDVFTDSGRQLGQLQPVGWVPIGRILGYFRVRRAIGEDWETIYTWEATEARLSELEAALTAS